MTQRQFTDWLEKLKLAWETKNPEAAAVLCAEKLIWYETPFDKPLTTKYQVLQEWKSVPESQKDITVSYEVINVTNNVGVAHWFAEFTRIPSGKRASLDGIYKVTLDNNGLCTEFHQWWNSKE